MYYNASMFSVPKEILYVTETLQKNSFEAYLVGGCVRDLLLGHEPKDFDVATNALPEQVDKLFRRSRLIGRRFKLVHVRFGRDVIEVATFRAPPEASKRLGGREDSWRSRRSLIDKPLFEKAGRLRVRGQQTPRQEDYESMSAKASSMP